MPLQLDSDSPGLWTDDAVQGPATHALIIGISSYPHLENGTSPSTEDKFGLGQLAVSALTAFRFFEWLRDHYVYQGAQLSTVRILLAPNDAEIAEVPDMTGAFAPADFNTCALALQAWKQELAAHRTTDAESSRSVFFFSGHGLEVSQQKQILLPSDYLNPGLPGVNRALSTLNLKQGMLSLDVRDQFFLIDACRNGSSQLGGVAVNGTEIFNVAPPDQNNPDVNSVVMYGTASGSQSWQPMSPTEGPSLFGEALLSAVRGGVSPDRSETPPTVWFNDVARYTNQQISNLLRQRGATVRQAVRGDLGFVGFVHAAPTPSGAQRGAGIVPLDSTSDGGSDPHAVRGYDGPAGITIGAGIAEGNRRGVRQADVAVMQGEFVEPDRGWTTFGADEEPHTWFGRETLTEVWTENTHAVDLQTNQAAAMRVLEVDRFEDSAHRVRIVVDSDRPVWLTIEAPNTTYGTTLPGYRDAVYELGMTWEGDSLVQLDVDLSVDTPLPLTGPARLWAQYRSLDADTAAAMLLREEMELAVGAVRSKTAFRASPIGAVVASLVLIHAGDWRAIPARWAENMATLPQFRDVSDGVVIWAELLSRKRSGAEERPEAALSLLTESEVAPLTGDATAFGLALCETLSSTLPKTSQYQRKIAQVSNWLGGMSPYLHPGGLFLVLSGRSGDINSSLVLRNAR